MEWTLTTLLTMVSTALNPSYLWNAEAAVVFAVLLLLLLTTSFPASETLLFLDPGGALCL
jgi:hypothetical protein